jgi:molybdopterin synthase sulfur carrier subunit
MLTVKYFASVREAVGLAEEQWPVPAEPTVQGLLQHLSQHHEAIAEMLGSDQTIMVAVNQSISRPGERLNDGDEVAFFPPMTGG